MAFNEIHTADHASETRFLADVLPVASPHRPIPPRILRRIYDEDQSLNDNWTGATNAEFAIYALGLVTLIVGVAAVFA